MLSQKRNSYTIKHTKVNWLFQFLYKTVQLTVFEDNRVTSPITYNVSTPTPPFIPLKIQMPNRTVSRFSSVHHHMVFFLCPPKEISPTHVHLPVMHVPSNHWQLATRTWWSAIFRSVARCMRRQRLD